MSGKGSWAGGRPKIARHHLKPPLKPRGKGFLRRGSLPCGGNEEGAALVFICASVWGMAARRGRRGRQEGRGGCRSRGYGGRGCFGEHAGRGTPVHAPQGGCSLARGRAPSRRHGDTPSRWHGNIVARNTRPFFLDFYIGLAGDLRQQQQHSRFPLA